MNGKATPLLAHSERHMLRVTLIAVAISLITGLSPALAYKMSCEEYCRTKICIQTNYNFVSCKPTCMQKCMIYRSDQAKKAVLVSAPAQAAQTHVETCRAALREKFPCRGTHRN